MSAGEVVVDVKGRDVSLEALLSRLETRMRQTDATGQQLADVFGRTVPAGQQKAADAALRHAQSLARMAQQMGDSARGANILRTALVENAGASDRAAASVLTQISSLERGRTLAQQFGDATKSSLLGIIGPAAAVGVAFRALGEIDDLAKLGAQAEQTAERFDRSARAAGTTGEAYTRALRAASGGTIADLNLQLAANRARLLGVADSADELAPLLAVARDRAQEMGISTTQAFNDLVTGLGRGSALILDNLGITVSVTEANKAYAAQLGKNASALTEAEQKQALINAVMTQGQASLAATGGALETAATKAERFAATLENVKAKAGAVFANLATPALEGANQLLTMGDRLAVVQEQTITGARTFEDYAARVALVNQQMQAANASTAAAVPIFGGVLAAVGPLNTQLPALSASQFAYAQSLIATGTAATEAIAKAQAVGDMAQSLATQLQAVGGPASETGSVLSALSTQLLTVSAAAPGANEQVLGLAGAFAGGQITAQQFRAALDTLQGGYDAQAQAAAQAAAMERFRHGEQTAGVAATDASSGALQSNTQALVDQIAKSQQSTIQGQQLASMQQTLAGLGAAVASGHQTAGDAALALAHQYNIAFNEALKLINAQAQIAAASGKGAAGVTEGRLERDTTADRAKVKSDQALEANRKLLSNLAKQSKAGGAARLSDQQKLDNQLLAQQDQANNRLADAEKEHQQRMLDIDKEFQKRQLEQSKANEISKRAGELGFLKSITASELNETKTGRAEIQRINERFYADFAEAQKQAQAGNLKMSEALVEQARHRAEIEQQYAEQIEEARKNKDASEVARLTALLAKERALLDEQQQQIVAGGDPNVKAREEATAEETAKFQESQDKIAASADWAADRIVTGAQRAGKAIRDTNVDLAEQDRILNRIGAHAGAPAPGAPGAPPAAPAGPTPAGAAPTASTSGTVDLAAIQAGLDAIRAAIDSMSGAVTGAQRETTGAVRGLSGRLVA